MAWSMEYAAATLSLALLLILLFKMNRSGGFYPPVAATMVGLIINFKRLHDFLLDHHRRHETYRVAYLTFSFILTTDPANVEHILRSNFENYVKGKSHHDVMEDLLGDGIFAVDGELWRQQRKLASFEFSTKVLKDFSSVVFRENAVKLSKILLEACRTKQIVEMQGVLLRSTMDGFCKLAFGVDINSSSNTNSGAEASFAMAFDTANALVMWRYFDPVWKLKRYFNILSEATMKENIKTVDDFVYKVIQSRKQENSVQKNHEAKHVVSDDILPNGYKVKKGDMVCYAPYSMGRMTCLWGSDAEEFRPERWLQNGNFQPQSPFKFTAFQAGPRICLGKDFAYMQMKIVAAVLVRFFKFESVEGMAVRYRPSLTLHMTEDGLNLHVKPRLDS